MESPDFATESVVARIARAEDHADMATKQWVRTVLETPQVPQRHHRYHRWRFAEFLRYIAAEGRPPTYREDGGRHSLRTWFDDRLRIGGRTARWATQDDPELLDWIVDYARMIGLRT